MNLKHMNKIELDTRIRNLVARERELLHEILLTLKEIDRRRTYLELGVASLFSYLVDGVGYSAGSAQCRIDGARLMSELPELGEKIQSGELKLHHLSLVQRTSREIAKQRCTKVASEDKKELLKKLVSKSLPEAQKEVASFFDLPVAKETKQKVQADESIRLELTISKELYTKIQQAQALLSHALGTNNLVRYLEYTSDRVIKSKTKAREATATMAVKVEVSEVEQELSKKDLETQNHSTNSSNKEPSPRGFSQKTKKLMLAKSQGCEFVDHRTGQRCGSQWFLQVDHKQSVWAGGTSVQANAQLLCSQHNRLKYQREQSTKTL